MSDKTWFDYFSEYTILACYMVVAPFIAVIDGIEYLFKVWIDYSQKLINERKAKQGIKEYDISE